MKIIATATKHNLARNILAAYRLALEAQEFEAAEHLLSALEVLTHGDVSDDSLRQAYLDLAQTATNLRRS